MTNLPPIERWKKYLRYDPTRWLLETDDPSIQLWYQIDIAHRPEDSRAVIDTRERVLYSDPVQAIFAAQDPLGFWNNPGSLTQPFFTATLWNLALLAELGIPRTSRRARNACEFILQNFLNDDGTFVGYGTFEGLNGVNVGYLLHALAYFNLAHDERVLRAARRLIQDAAEDSVHDLVYTAAIWAIQEIELHDTTSITHRKSILDKLRTTLARRKYILPIRFPQFDVEDPLFTLRVMTTTELVHDACLSQMIEAIVAKQDEYARWRLEDAMNSLLTTPFERAGEPSRWITLNALRVITKLVLNEKKED